MLLILALGLVWAGCTPKKQYIYTSRPTAQSVSKAIFDARIEPIKNDNPYFVGFRLTVKNKTSEPLEINLSFPMLRPPLPPAYRRFGYDPAHRR
jgi:hypothetical protein